MKRGAKKGHIRTYNDKYGVEFNWIKLADFCNKRYEKYRDDIKKLPYPYEYPLPCCVGCPFLDKDKPEECIYWEVSRLGLFGRLKKWEEMRK